MWTRKDLKDNAKANFKPNYWMAVLVSLIFSLISGGASAGGGARSFTKEFTKKGTSDSFGMSPAAIVAVIGAVLVIVMIIAIVGIILGIFIFAPLRVGCHRFFVKNMDEPAELREVGFAFSNSYMNVVKTMFLMKLFIVLWSMLFIIPGIIKAYEYRMIPFLLAEDPSMSYKDAFAKSKEMMMGNKWNAFVLDLSFLGWYILGAITCQIVTLFYVAPYKNQTDAELYGALK